MNKETSKDIQALRNLLVLVEKLERDAYKRGYEKGFSVGTKSRPSKTLGKYKIVKR